MAVRRPRLHVSRSLSPTKLPRDDNPTISTPPALHSSHTTPAASPTRSTLSQSHHLQKSRLRGSNIGYLCRPPLHLLLPGRQHLSQGSFIDSHAGSSAHHSTDHIQEEGTAFVDAIQIFGDPEPAHKPASQKRQNQCRRWSQDVIPTLLRPYMQYVRVTGSLSTVENVVIPPCVHSCASRQLQVTCLYFDRELLYSLVLS